VGNNLVICPLPGDFFQDFWKQHPLPESTTLISHQYIKEIEEDQNTSLGIIMGSLILGIALILAAAIHGG